MSHKTPHPNPGEHEPKPTPPQDLSPNLTFPNRTTKFGTWSVLLKLK
jgi:hypothetical protein